MTDIRNIEGASNLYPSQPNSPVTLNATAADIGNQWYESAHSGTWQPAPPSQQKQWALQLQQEASQDPQLQQFLNANPSILSGLNNGTLTSWQLEPLFKGLAPLLTTSSMTPGEKLGFAKGWTSCAYNDAVSGYSSAEMFQRFKDSIHAAVSALELISNPAALQAMQAAEEEVDSIVYQPNTGEPLAFSEAETNTGKAMTALSGS